MPDKRTQVFLGFRAGVAPLRSLIQAALADKSSHPVYLFLGGTGTDDLLLDSEWQALLSGLRRIERGRAWLEQHPNFERRLEEEQRVDRGEPGGAPEEPAP